MNLNDNCTFDWVTLIVKGHVTGNSIKVLDFCHTITDTSAISRQVSGDYDAPGIFALQARLMMVF